MYYIVFGGGKVLYIGDDVKAQIKVMQVAPESMKLHVQSVESAEEALSVIEQLRTNAASHPELFAEVSKQDTVIEEANKTVTDVAQEVFSGLESIGVSKVNVDEFMKKIQTNGDEFLESVRQMGIKGAVKAGEMFVRLGNRLRQVGEEDQTND